MSIKTGIKHNRRRIRLVAVVGLSMIAAAVSVVQGFQRSQVYAGENQAFQGIGRIVKEHNTQEDPFVILDIVPGQADVAWSDREGSLHNYELSLATIGYLVSGQTPIEQDLLRIFGPAQVRICVKFRPSSAEIRKAGTGSSLPSPFPRKKWGSIPANRSLPL